MTDDRPGLPEDQLDALIREGQEIWEGFRLQNGEAFSLFIPCDHRGAHEALAGLRDRATTFLELGSATGVVTIMADLLGFEAYGIEIESWLVDASTELAEQFGSSATFAEGTFVPLEYQDEVDNLSADSFTPTHGACGYEELGMDLRDFDVVFCFPWPGDELWLRELVRRHARPDTLLLTYDDREGFVLAEDLDAEPGQ